MWNPRNLLKSFAKSIQPSISQYFRKKTSKASADVSRRCRPPCSYPPYVYPDKKPCFDINKVLVERADIKTVQMIRPFLYENYFTREPCISGLFIPFDSPYLGYLADHYTNSGDRWLAFEVDERTFEKKLIGVGVASKKHPWEADLYEDWGDVYREPESFHLYFHAHCYRKPNIFKKYNVPFLYNIDVVVTTERLPGYGVGDLLLRTAVLYALEMRFPLIQVIATNSHMINSCKRAGLKHEWSMKYRDFVNRNGQTVMSNRSPHTSVNIYIRRLHPGDCAVPDRMSSPGLYELFSKQYAEKGPCLTKPGIEAFSPLPRCPRTC